jgi:protein TonB|tara:strand:+ start:398 stop:751 length:354 start_codon:yes stop_codon:yes gene_type:complete
VNSRINILLFAIFLAPISFESLDAQVDSDPQDDSWVADGYPSVSRRSEEEGTVGVRLEVSPQGTVSKCNVIESSGFQNLDRDACKQLMKGARFKPATDDDGKAVTGYFETKVRYELD